MLKNKNSIMAKKKKDENKEENKPVLIEKKLQDMITELNLQNLAQELLDETENISKMEDLKERQKGRLALSRSIYSSIFSEMINRILFSDDFIENIESLDFEKKLEVMFKFHKYSYEALLQENKKLQEENQGYQIIVQQESKIHDTKREFFDKMFKQLTIDSKMEFTNNLLAEITEDDGEEVIEIKNEEGDE